MGHGILLPCCTLESCDRNDPAPCWHRVWIPSAARILLLFVLVQEWKQRALLPWVLWLLVAALPCPGVPQHKECATVLTWECLLSPLSVKQRAWSVIRYLNCLHIACSGEAALELGNGVWSWQAACSLQHLHIPRVSGEWVIPRGVWTWGFPHITESQNRLSWKGHPKIIESCSWPFTGPSPSITACAWERCPNMSSVSFGAVTVPWGAVPEPNHPLQEELFPEV